MTHTPPTEIVKHPQFYMRTKYKDHRTSPWLFGADSIGESEVETYEQARAGLTLLETAYRLGVQHGRAAVRNHVQSALSGVLSD